MHSLHCGAANASAAHIRRCAEISHLDKLPECRGGIGAVHLCIGHQHHRGRAERGACWGRRKPLHSDDAPMLYNEAATLMFVTGEEAIEHLFSRGTHRSWATMRLWQCYSHTCVHHCGLRHILWTCRPDAAHWRLHRQDTFAMVDIFAFDGNMTWMDPGAFALLGAASFLEECHASPSLSQSSWWNLERHSIPLAAHGRDHTSKKVADAITHSLYHALLEVKRFPFMDGGPPLQKSLELVEIKDVMAAPVIT